LIIILLAVDADLNRISKLDMIAGNDIQN